MYVTFRIVKVCRKYEILVSVCLIFCWKILKVYNCMEIYTHGVPIIMLFNRSVITSVEGIESVYEGIRLAICNVYRTISNEILSVIFNRLNEHISAQSKYSHTQCSQGGNRFY